MQLEKAILNNQASPVNLTGVVLDSTETTSVILKGEIRRTTDDFELISNIQLVAQFRQRTMDWNIGVLSDTSENPIGVAFSMDASGQVKYTSENLTGANYVGTFKLRASRFTV